MLNITYMLVFAAIESKKCKLLHKCNVVSLKDYIMKRIKTMEDIAEIVKAERKRQGITQEDLAGIAGVSHRFIINIEKGKNSSPISRVLGVLECLGIKLFYGEN